MTAGAGMRRMARTESRLARAAGDYAAGRFAEAAQALREALAGEPDSAALHANLAVVLDKQGDPGAEAELRIALCFAPSLAAAWFNLGNRRARGGALGSAARAFRRALALDATHVGALTNLANAIRDGEEFGEAIGLYRRTLVLD